MSIFPVYYYFVCVCVIKGVEELEHVVIYSPRHPTRTSKLID
jgi:hypothetical protein